MKPHALALGLLLMEGCGGDSTIGSTTGPSPNIPNVAGIWRGTDRLISASGGECVGALIQSFVGGVPDQVTLSLTQSSRDISGMLVSQSTGTTFSVSGTASNNAVSLNATFSSAGRITGIRCLTGLIRDMNLQTAAINGSVSGNRLTADEVINYNVVTPTGVGVGVLVVRATLDLAR